MKNSSQKQLQHSSALPDFNERNGDIYFKELIFALWQGKVWVIACILPFFVGSVIFALTAQQWWSSTAKIIEPQVYSFSDYYQQVKLYQPLFDIYQEDGMILVSDELDSLVDAEKLFLQFISAYNSSNNKNNFLDASVEFQAFKKQLDKDIDTDETVAKEQTHRLYSEWFNKITAVADMPNRKHSPYTISFQATTKESSYILLHEYVESIKLKVFNEALNNLQTTVNAKRNELLQQKIILETQAKNALAVEVERSKYALEIATAANLNKPVPNIGDNELFSISLGSEALHAKVKALKSITNLSVIEPRLQQINAKFEMLSNLKINRNIQFQTFHYLESIEQPFSRDKPKRTLIVVFATLLGGMLGMMIVLARYIFRK